MALKVSAGQVLTGDQILHALSLKKGQRKQVTAANLICPSDRLSHGAFAGWILITFLV